MPDGQSSNTYGGSFIPLEERPSAPAFSQSSAEYTTVTIKIPGVWRVPQGVSLDTQVQAIAGYMYYRDKQYHFVGQYSDWSNTQTLIIGQTSTTTSTPTVTPTAPDTNGNSTNSVTLPLDVLIIIIAVVALLAVALSVLLFRRHRKTAHLSKLTFSHSSSLISRLQFQR